MLTLLIMAPLVVAAVIAGLQRIGTVWTGRAPRDAAPAPVDRGRSPCAPPSGRQHGGRSRKNGPTTLHRSRKLRTCDPATHREAAALRGEVAELREQAAGLAAAHRPDGERCPINVPWGHGD